MAVMTFVHEHIWRVEELTEEANASTIHHKTMYNECPVGSDSRSVGREKKCQNGDRTRDFLNMD